MKVTIKVDLKDHDENKLALIASMATEKKDLAILAKSKNVGVRCNVADNKHTSTDTLEKLAKDPEDIVRAAVADNKHTRKATVEKLTHDKVTFVADTAKKNLMRKKARK